METNWRHDLQYGSLVLGVDEAGRGPLAGPVVCAVCAMGDNYLPGIDDSKKLSKVRLVELYSIIIERAVGYCIVAIDNNTIDNINILNATKLGMYQAISQCIVSNQLTSVDCAISPILQSQCNNLHIDEHGPMPCRPIAHTDNLTILVDHVKLSIPNSVSITHGDSISYNIAAASILAKVSRDNIMCKYAIQYPHYNFDRHKGYPTQLHYQAIQQYGVTPIHRKSFRLV
ncbi:MAG: ribonuclease HII [Clostridiales bacterium]|jgi:ribonuclease HII|nr:ribonuclease HII [Clostridiales bacterium]